MTAPLVIKKGRFRLMHSGDAIRIDCDETGGMIILLSKEEKIALSKALWYSAKGSPD